MPKETTLREVADSIEEEASAALDSVSETYVGPEDPRLPEDIRDLPVGKREDYVDEFNWQYWTYKKDDHETYDEESPDIVNRIQFADINARKKMNKKWRYNHPKDTEEEVSVSNEESLQDSGDNILQEFNALESTELNGVTYFRIREDWDDLGVNPTDKTGNTIEVKKGEDYRATLIEEGWSLNGRYYTKESIDDISRIVNEKSKVRSFMNHGETFGRDPRDWVGFVYESVREGSKAESKLHVFDEPDGDFIRERIEEAPDLIGMSIDAFVRMEMGEKEGIEGPIVKEVAELNCVDVVMFPGAKGSIGSAVESVTSQQKPQKEEEIMTMTVAELKDNHPDTYQLLVSESQSDLKGEVEAKESQIGNLTDEVALLKEQNIALSAKVDEIEGKEREAAFRKEVAEHVASELPEHARRTDEDGKVKFIELCVSLGPEKIDTIKEMVQERKQSFETGAVEGEGFVEKKVDKVVVKEVTLDAAKAINIWDSAKTA